MTTFPSEIVTFEKLQLIENWWEAYDLQKVDLSNNEIESIPEEISVREVSIQEIAISICKSLNVFRFRVVYLAFEPEFEQVGLNSKWPVRDCQPQVPRPVEQSDRQLESGRQLPLRGNRSRLSAR